MRLCKATIENTKLIREYRIIENCNIISNKSKHTQIIKRKLYYAWQILKLNSPEKQMKRQCYTIREYSSSASLVKPINFFLP